jgi:hypothetical protein
MFGYQAVTRLVTFTEGFRPERRVRKFPIGNPRFHRGIERALWWDSIFIIVMARDYTGNRDIFGPIFFISLEKNSGGV